MKKLALILLVSTALIAPSAAEAANVNVQVDLKVYGGPAAYLAVYVVDANGNYDSTLWVAGSKYKYLGSLRGWARGFAASGAKTLSGISGASVGAGQTLNVSATLSDALINAGYSIVVDTSIEHLGNFVTEARVPLNTGGGSASGNGVISQLKVSM